MSTYRIEWNCCGSVTETEAWEPAICPICTDEAAPFRKDAARYRWLRDNGNRFFNAVNYQGVGEVMDASVDAAMKA